MGYELSEKLSEKCLIFNSTEGRLGISPEGPILRNIVTAKNTTKFKITQYSITVSFSIQKYENYINWAIEYGTDLEIERSLKNALCFFLDINSMERITERLNRELEQLLAQALWG